MQSGRSEMWLRPRKGVMTKTKVLFVAATPLGTTPLRIDEEIRAITARLRATEYRDSLVLTSAWAARVDDLLQLLNEHKPHIVHFSGHGADDGRIMLVDEHGSPKRVPTRAMRALFSALRDNIRLVVLNACYSTSQARAVADIVGCAVGMRSTVPDAAATIFAASFYCAIGFGRSVAEAFKQGTAALSLDGIDREAKPRLFAARHVEPAELILVNRALQTSSTTRAGCEVGSSNDGIDELVAILRHRADQMLDSLSSHFKHDPMG